MSTTSSVSTTVIDELKTLGEEFLEDGFHCRLVMTDDIGNFANIRQRAKDKVVVGDDTFYYGCSLRPSLQDRVDTLVRTQKKSLIALCKLSAEEHLEHGIAVTFDKEQRAYLIVLKCCGMGFFVSEKTHTPRELRPKRATVAELGARINAQAGNKRSGDRSISRRGFINLATVSQQ